MKVALNGKYLSSFKKIKDGNEVNYVRFLVDDTFVVFCKDNDNLCAGFNALEPHTILCNQSLFDGHLFYSIVQVK